MTPPIRAILFDLDGVIRTFDPAREAEIEARHGLPRGTLWPVLFEARRLGKAVTGQFTDEAWRADAGDELLRTLGPRAAAALVELSASPGIVNAEVLSLARQLRKRFPVGLLTNGTTRLMSDLAALDLVSEFDTITTSCATGHPKPAPNAYLEAARALKTPPENILFIDDSATHIRGAGTVRMPAILFTGAAELRQRLRPFGVM